MLPAFCHSLKVHNTLVGEFPTTTIIYPMTVPHKPRYIGLRGHNRTYRVTRQPINATLHPPWHFACIGDPFPHTTPTLFSPVYLDVHILPCQRTLVSLPSPLFSICQIFLVSFLPTRGSSVPAWPLTSVTPGVMWYMDLDLAVMASNEACNMTSTYNRNIKVSDDPRWLIINMGTVMMRIFLLNKIHWEFRIKTAYQHIGIGKNDHPLNVFSLIEIISWFNFMLMFFLVQVIYLVQVIDYHWTADMSLPELMMTKINMAPKELNELGYQSYQFFVITIQYNRM